MATTMSEAERIERVYAERARTVPAARYSLMEPGTLFIEQERERVLLQELARHGIATLADKTILDLGCGTGAWLRNFIRWGADPGRLAGLDLLADRIESARTLLPAEVRLERGDGARLPFADGSFDLVLQSTVFSSILDGAIRQKVAREMLRVLAPGGLVVWYDARVDSPGHTATFAGISRREIAALFPGCRMRLRAVTLAPPLARRLASRSVAACRLLAALPFSRTHWLALIRRGRQ
jgi:ubiquinone/menaquinone biosynthesis C-methylase UbiE